MLNIRIDHLKGQIEDMEEATFSRPAPLNVDQQLKVLELKVLLNIAVSLDAIESAIIDHD